MTLYVIGFRFKEENGKKIYHSAFPVDEQKTYNCSDCGNFMLVGKGMPEFLSTFKGVVEKFQCKECMTREFQEKGKM